MTGIADRRDDGFLRALLEQRAAKALSAQPGAGIPRRSDPDAPVPLTPAQARLWFLAQLEPDSAAYLLPSVLRLRGVLDADAMLAAVRDLVTRHEVLRSVIEERDGEPVSVVVDPGAVPVSTVDITEDELDAALAVDLRRPFRLDVEPPTRAVLYRIADDDHVLALTFHHIAIDDWSHPRAMSDLAACYAVRVQGSPPPAEPELQHADVALWEASRQDDADAQAQWWADRLAGAPPVLELPVDRPRPAVADWTGETAPVRIPADLAERVRAAAIACGGTPFMVFLAGWQALLSRLTGSTDVVVGVPEAGRADSTTEEVVGCFINTLPMRTEVAPATTGRELLAAAKETSLDAFGHAGVSFEQIVRRLAPERDRSTTPIFQVLLNVLDTAGVDVEFAGLQTVELDQPINTVKYDLNLALVRTDGGYDGGISYRTDIFDPATVERIGSWFVTLLDGMLAEPDRSVGSVPLDHVDGPLVSGPELVVTSSRLLHETVERWARETPDATAIVASDGALTYAELDRHANQVAHRLLAAGVAADKPVAVLADRTTRFLVGALGVLKAGGAYLPVDPIFPDERVAGMLDSVDVRVVLAQSDLAGRVQGRGREVLTLDDLGAFSDQPAGRPDVAVEETQVAYVIFTSGSTGRPKGVGVEHRNITAYLAAAMAKAEGPVGGFDRRVFALVATVAADSGMTTVWGSLGTGSTLHLLDREISTDPQAYARYLAANHIDVVKMVPSLLELLATYGDLAAVLPRRLLILGGEALSWNLADRVHAARPELVLQNHYGPTEASVSVLVCDTEAYPESERIGMVPLGVPFAGVDVYVADDAGHPLPAGIAGELWIGGPLVARGYLGHPELTAAKFTPDPVGGTTRCYRTGDRVRVAPNGVVLFLGRIDDQVKVRGYRVELGEVMTALRAAPGINEAVVMPVGEAHLRRLAAWVTPRAGEPVSVSAVRAALRTTLPDYMVPTSITVLDRLPLNPNGKVDRRALPEPVDTVAGDERIAPASAMELLVASTWSEVLGIAEPSVTDDFFAVGGHSFAATRVVARLRQALRHPVLVRTIFDHPVLGDLAHALGTEPGPGGAALPSIAARPDPSAPAPLSPAQLRLWFLSQLEPDSAAYNVPINLRLAGPLDGEALLAAVRDVAERHHVLRSRIVDTAGVPSVVLGAAGSVPILSVDVDAEDLDAALMREADRPFTLAVQPPMRATLFRVHGDEHVLALTLHHVATDAWSRGMIVGDLAVAYAARIGIGPQLPPASLQYADYAEWLAEREDSSDAADDPHADWWVRQLAGLEPVLDLPLDRPRPTVASWAGGEVGIELSAELSQRVRDAAVATGATPFMVLLAAWQALLSRVSGSTDIAVGVAESGRHLAGTDSIVGCFVNTLVMRTDVAGDPTARELIRRVRATALDTFAHADVPFERVVDRVQPERSLTTTPIFQAALNVLDTSSGSVRFTGVDVTPVEPPSTLVKFDLDLGLVDDGVRFSGGMAFRSEVFDESTIRRMADWFRALLAGLVADLDAPMAAITLEPTTGATICGPRRDIAATLMHSPVQRWARETPDATAVVAADGTLTYAELDRRANQVAHRLLALGVRADEPVAVLAERTTHLAVALVGVLKAGGAYVALDPVYPDDRIATMLTAAGARVVLTEAAQQAKLAAGREVLVLDDPATLAVTDTAPDVVVDPAQLAYVIFTSGSTGMPKGVAVEHRNFAQYLPAVLERFGAGIAEVPRSFALVSTIAADLGLTMVWGALATGGALHLVDREVATDPAAYAAYVAAHRLDVIKMVPSQLELLATHAELASVLPGRTLVLAGEACPWSLVDRVRAAAPGIDVQVHYGPSETTVAVFGCSIDDVPVLARDGVVPLGTPFPNVDCYVVDAGGRMVPSSVPGELWISGPSVARGYLGRDEETAQRFVLDPLGTGRRCYRTGDRVRVTSGGAVRFLGRVDDQVKVRGFRVELGEVATALRELPGVGEAFVLPVGEAHQRKLAAWITPATGASTVDVTAVRGALRNRLPDYMVPASIAVLDALPLNPNGKVDRHALPAPDTAPAAADYVPPSTPSQQRVVDAWMRVLDVPRIGVDDDFFALGGDSFAAVRAVRLIDPSLRVIELFTHPTVGELAAVVDGGAGSAQTGLLYRLAGPPKGVPTTLTVVCVPYGGGAAVAYQPLATELAATMPGTAVVAVELPGHDPARPDEERISLDAVADAVLAELGDTVQGPILVYGHCVGTALATELALRLEAARREVVGLIVAGSFPTATLPGRLASWINRKFPQSRFTSDRASRDLLRSMGGLMEEDMADEAAQRTILHSMRHDVDNSQAWFTRELNRAEPRTLTAPALCVVGERDRGTDLYRERYAEWAAFAPQVGLALVPKAGHYFLKHQANYLAGLIASAVGDWRAGRLPPRVPHVSVTGPEARRNLRDFYVVAAGQTISIMGSTLTLFALGLWVYKETGNLSSYALITFLSLVPRVVVGPVGGALTDRIDRRLVLLGCEVAGGISVVALIALASTHTLTLWNICVIVIVLALATGVHDPTYIAATAQLVPKPYLAQANGIAQLGDGFGNVVAPLAGGALLLLVGLPGVIAIDAFSFAVGILTLVKVRFPNRLYSKPEESFRKTIAGGWHYMAKRKPLVVMAGFFLVDNFFGALAIVLTVPLVFAFNSAAAVGVVTGVAGVGAILGSVLMMLWGGTRRRASGMVGMVYFVGLGILLMGLRPSILLVSIGILMRNAASNLVNAHWRALIQVKVHTELQGRVLAANQMMALAMTPVAYLGAPFIVHAVNPLLGKHGALSNTFVGHLFGVGDGRGIGLVVAACGISLLIWAALGMRYKPLRYMEDALSDATPGAEMAATPDEAEATANEQLQLVGTAGGHR
ncbi:MAG: amino acid adenylation domain-containing protein [Mycobacteriales bacterium]